MQQSFMCSNGQCTRYIYPVLDKRLLQFDRRQFALSYTLLLQDPSNVLHKRFPHSALVSGRKLLQICQRWLWLIKQGSSRLAAGLPYL